MVAPTAPPGCHIPARSGPGFRPGRWCPNRPGFPPARLVAAPFGCPVLPRLPVEGGARPEAAISVCVAAPGSTSIQRVPAHLDALYALAYMHNRDDEIARHAVAGALGSARRDLDAGASIGGQLRWAGLWRG
jgi:hypothetical protein